MNDEINQAMDKAFRLLMSAPTAEDVARALALVEWSQQMRLALTAQAAEADRQERARTSKRRKAASGVKAEKSDEEDDDDLPAGLR